MKPSTARHRTDTSSAPLITLLVSSGVGYVSLGGAIDGAAVLGNYVALCDWKTSAKAKRTKTQIALVARGIPIWFLANEVDVLHVVRWLRSHREESRLCASGVVK